MCLGIGSDSETDSIDEDGVENFKGIDGKEMTRIVKDISLEERILNFTEDELERAKKRRLHRRPQSDPQGPIGFIFKENGNLK
jgi:hypothetical protein